MCRFLFLFLFVYSFSAHAVVESVPPVGATGQYCAGSFGCASTPLLACRNWTTINITVIEGPRCYSTYYGFGPYLTGDFTCPTVSPPYTFNSTSGMCEREAPACPAAGTLHSSGVYDIGTDPNKLAGALIRGCTSNGCATALGEMNQPHKYGLVSSVYHYYSRGSLVYTGATCIPTSGVLTPSTVSENVQQTCASGQTAVTGANGYFKCYKDMTGTDGTTTAVAVSGHDPATVETPTSTSTATTTNGDGTTSTTTTTTTYSAGVFSGTGSQNGDPRAAYCAENPQAEMCIDSALKFNAPAGTNPDPDRDFYEESQTETIEQIFNRRYNEIRQTPLGQLAAGFALQVNAQALDGCWSLDMNMGIVNFGTHQFCIPTGVLLFLKICVMLTALFTARALIFGG